MNLPEFSVRRPYTTLMIFLAILIISFITIPKLPVDLMPEIEVPVISVIVPYPGVNASDVENDVTKYLEDYLIGIEDLDELNSISKDNLSIVSCKFKWGKNLDVAVNDVKDRLDFAKKDIYKHAPDAEEPMIFKFSTSMTPVLVLSVSSKTLWKDLYYIADRQISDQIKRAEGVGTVMIFGGIKRQINIYLDWEKINGYKIPPDLIIHRLIEENIDFPLGEIKKGRRNYFLRIKGRFVHPEEIRDILIKTIEGRPIYLKDVAKVDDYYEEEKSKAYTNGEETLILIVQKQSGRNTVVVSNNVRKKIKEIRNVIPNEIKIDVLFDSAEMIIKSIKNLVNTIITAGILVILVTVFLLRRTNLSFIVSISIPFSLICAFLFLYIGKFTINIISLMSLAIAIGMVVDNSIVILENITRHFEEGERIEKASIYGASEVGTPIIASTITTIVVFIPLIFTKGFISIIFKQLGYIVSTTIFMSLIVALMLVPMLSSKIIKKREHKETKFYKIGEIFLKKVDDIYTDLLKWCLKHRNLFLYIILILFFISIFLFKFIGVEFFPDADTGRIETTILMNPATRLEETDKVVKKIGEIYEEEIPEMIAWYGMCGESATGIYSAIGREEGSYAGSISARLLWREERKRTDKEMAEIIRKRVKDIPGIELFSISTASPLQSMLMGGAKQIEIELKGSDLNKIVKYSEMLKEKIEKIPGAVNVDISYKKDRIELHLKVDKEKTKNLGISTAQISQILRNYIYGYTATKYREGGEDFDIFVQLEEFQRYNIEKIEEMPLFTSSGKVIKLKDVAKIEFEPGPVQIDRKNRQRIVKVRCDTYKRAMSKVVEDIKNEIKNLNIPKDIIIDYGGMVKEQRESFADLRLLLILGVVLVYMVMVAQFESFKTPFIIFFSIPFTFIGSIIFLLITGVNFSVASFMSIIMLMGVVVNNAIVLVDYINILRTTGYELLDAIIKGARNRLRPIMMTSLTTIFGMIPMALGKGTGGEIWQSFGVPAIGGFLVSWIITLLLVPVIYLMMNKEK
ncbi:MAG: efflux RND transporter permease subunit [Candidatus Omnitrophica bacterium]|nr:efflux RND transporter permease subunit [Candidatus Omnitrophota bacterium]